MNKFWKAVVSLIWLFHLVNSINDSIPYCNLEQYCVRDGSDTSTLHIGCINNFNTSQSHYKVIKLKYSDRTFLINELNQFRSDVALGEIYAKQISSSTFSYMKKLNWNYELENLLQLMIMKHSNSKFYCISTNVDHKPIQLFISVKRPQPFSLEKVFSLAIDEVKLKSLQSYSSTNQNEIITWSQCYHPDTWAFACAVGDNIYPLNSNDKNMLIRCAFYGKRFKKSYDNFKYGELCSGCGIDGCSDLFPGLCGSDIDNRRGNKGPPGIPGYPGTIGLAGSKGMKGSKGERGMIGISGLSGPKGKRGIQGITSITPIDAATGEKGLPGENAKSENCPGESGNDGIVGVIGPDGPNGAIGEVGDKGEKAIYTKGEKGEPGLTYKGKKGDNGLPGRPGLPGTDGDEGMWGDEGDAVYTIDVRFDRSDNCMTCSPGPQGLQGLPGPPGPQGPEANLEESDTIIFRDITTRASNFLNNNV